jgi:hypothetical protein
MPTESTPAPAISDALIEYLNRNFPDRCPELGMTAQEVWMAAGSARVIRHLRAVRERQLKVSLTGQE